LNDHGLWTSHVGTWHLYEFFDMPVKLDQRCGFERFIGYQSHNDHLDGIRFWAEDEVCREFVGGHRTRATIAIERLREILTDRDFGFFVSFPSPHYPLQPHPAFEALHRDVDITLRDTCGRLHRSSCRPTARRVRNRSRPIRTSTVTTVRSSACGSSARRW
jgi:hypothetical protein